MQNDYAKAFMAHIASGASVDAALSGLVQVLKRRHHTKLLPTVLRIVLRTLEADAGLDRATIRFAREADRTALESEIARALASLGATTGVTTVEVVDETLIGGFVAQYAYREHDQSYKRALTNLYESITA